MKKQRISLALVGLTTLLLTLSFGGRAAVNPLSVEFVNGTTSFEANHGEGRANYKVSVNSEVIPTDALLTLHLSNKGASLGLNVRQIVSPILRRQISVPPCGNSIPICESSFLLTAGQSCCLVLALTSDMAGNYTLQPKVSTIPATYSATAPTPLAVNVTNDL